jgi:hypothetical protein
LGNPATTTVPGFNVGCCNPAYTGTYQLANVVGSYSQVIENTNSGYVNVRGELSLGGMPFKFNVGVRDEYTDVTTIGLGQQPT